MYNHSLNVSKSILLFWVHHGKWKSEAGQQKLWFSWGTFQWTTNNIPLCKEMIQIDRYSIEILDRSKGHPIP